MIAENLSHSINEWTFDRCEHDQIDKKREVNEQWNVVYKEVESMRRKV